MYWNGHTMGGWGWFAMSLTTLILVALIITVAAYVLRPLTRGGSASEASSAPAPTPDSGEGAERLLAERFARGEIDAEEYLKRRAVLRTRTTARESL